MTRIKRRRKTPKSKVVILDPRIWVKSSEIKKEREMKLRKQKGRCAITGVLLKENAVYDHCHEDGVGESGRFRGVIASEVNMLEGRFLQLFKRAKIQNKYGISFEDFLINLGYYLKQDNTQEKFHHRYMDDFRKVVKRWTVTKLVDTLKEDFNIVVSPNTPKEELVQMYVQHWVYKVESIY
jgi:hypothetical protein